MRFDRRCFGSALAVASLVLVEPAAATGISITDAKVEGGKLVVTGTAPGASQQVKLDDRYTAMSNASKLFSFNIANYLPSDCIVDLVSGSATGTGVVADCAERGLSPRGAWGTNASYLTNDLVTFQGSSWRAKRNSINKPPATNVADWERFAAKGDPGQAGPIGPAGPSGSAGPTGDAGPAGAIGETGPAGPIGETGPAGPIGETGPAGAPGPRGPEGPAGPPGVAGPQGAEGQQGPQGPQGPQGMQGAQGQPGVVALVPFALAGGTYFQTGSPDTWLFSGPTVSITASAGQKITVAAGFPAFTHQGGPGGDFRVSVCRQYSYGVFPLFPPQGVTVGPDPVLYSVNVSMLVATDDTYVIGPCGANRSPSMVGTDVTNGWVMVTNGA